MIEQNPTLTLNINRKIFDHSIVQDMVRIAYGGAIPRPSSRPHDSVVTFYAHISDRALYKTITQIEELKANVPTGREATELLDIHDAADYIIMMLTNIRYRK